MDRFAKSFILVIVCIAVLLAGFSSSARLRLCKKSGIFICSTLQLILNINPDSTPAIPDTTCKKFYEAPDTLSYTQLAHLFFHPPRPSLSA